MRRSVKKLGESFYDRPDVNQIARELLGKVLVTIFEGKRTSGRIVETEAYNGIEDRASHAYGGKRSERLIPMYGRPGTTYIYLCYGLHHLFNIVTNKSGVPHAVLVRALEPIDGVAMMLQRTGKPQPDHTLTRGPGNVSRALGLSRLHTGDNLLQKKIFVEDDGCRYAPEDIVVTTRIGVDYAGVDAALPYRYLVRGNRYVSARKK